MKGNALYMDLATSKFHLLFGTFFFGVLMVICYFLYVTIYFVLVLANKGWLLFAKM